MTARKTLNQEQRQSALAPETHNSEQDDHLSQAQEVSEDAQELTKQTERPLQSSKGPGKSDLMDDSTQDVVDHMKDMDKSGRVDMGAYSGEPNHDDNEAKYGKGHKPDPGS